MAAIPELLPPGVEVAQQLRVASPVIASPNLRPCIVGVCKEIREILNSDGTVNSDILVSGPALATASVAGSYTSMDGLTLSVRVNGGVVQTFTLPTGATPPTAMTAQEVAAAINGSTIAPVDFSAGVKTVGANTYLRLTSAGSGNDQIIQIIGGTALSKFGWSAGYTNYGLGSYQQIAITLPQLSFPDPRGNLTELDIDEDSIRVFLDLGVEIREILQTESFLRKGSSIVMIDDGDGDTTTPLLDLSENLLAAPDSASITGLVDLSTAQPLHNTTLALKVDGSGEQTIQFYGQPIPASSAATGWTWPNIQSSDLVLKINNTNHTVNLSAGVAALADLIDEINDSVEPVFGFNIAYECGSAGEDDGADYLGLFPYAQPGPTVQLIMANTSIWVQNDASTAHTEIFGGAGPFYQTLGRNAGSEPIDDVVDQINNVFPTSVASWSAIGNKLVLTSATSGNESTVEINTASTALGAPQPTPTTLLGLDVQVGANKFYGAPFAVRVGDHIYANGAFVGMVVEVHPLAQLGQVRLDREVSTSGTWTTWYAIAKNLNAVSTSEWGVSVPTPDLQIDNEGSALIKHDFLRDTTGQELLTAAVSLYCMYTAVRLDVSASAADPSLLSFDTTTEIEAALDPVSPDNPLAFGLFLAKSNAAGVAVSGIGVDEATVDAPYGTVLAYQKAAEFLQPLEVYAIAPMTSDAAVASILFAHVVSMSEPEQKGERIVIFHFGTPLRRSDTLVASGNDADSIVVGPDNYLNTKAATLSQSLLSQGIDPANILISDGVYLDLGADAYNWNVIGSVLDGTKLKVNTAFGAGDNSDAFFYETIGDWPVVISGSFSVKIRGAVVSSKDEEITTIYNRGAAYSSRRFWMEQLGQVVVTVGSVDQLVPGFYFCAAKAGQVAGLSPAQPVTNYPVAGFKGVTDTNKRYTNVQMNQGASGGAEWIIQRGDGAPLLSRHQITTDLTSIERREQSIVRALDFSAKVFRSLLLKYVGRYNITKVYLDTLSAVAQGGSKWLVEVAKVLANCSLNNLVQDTDQPDTVLIDISAEVLYPGNYLRVVIVV